MCIISIATRAISNLFTRRLNKYNCIVVLGPTASGKTRLACQIAHRFNGAIISADSRQVYRHLDIGTGKDLSEYTVNGKKIPYYLIDIREPGVQFYLHEFVQECEMAFKEIISKQQLPLICGGTGLYLDSLVKDFSYTSVAEDPEFRLHAESLSKEELTTQLMSLPDRFRSHADLNSKKRIIRAIEVARAMSAGSHSVQSMPKPFRPYYIGLEVSAEKRKELIEKRLISRIESGLIEEVKNLLSKGITHERLTFLGLEYKMVSSHLRGELTLNELKSKLYTAIVQYSKRQMTWFRKMEKEGVSINWVAQEDIHAAFSMIEKEFIPQFSPSI
jgi:tRNA dimethylallyltransferase